MSEILQALLAGGGITGLAGALFGWLQGRANNKLLAEKDKAIADRERVAAAAALELAAKAQPVEHFQLLVVAQEKRSDKLEAALEKCQDHHIECAREMGELRGQVKAYSELQAQLMQHIQHLIPPLVPPSPRAGVTLSGNPPIGDAHEVPVASPVTGPSQEQGGVPPGWTGG